MNQLRSDRQATARGGYGMGIQLNRMDNTAQVYWSTDGTATSYVVAQHEDTYELVSINGLGEIRWTEPLSADHGPYAPGRNARHDAAVAYFFDLS